MRIPIYNNLILVVIQPIYFAYTYVYNMYISIPYTIWKCSSPSLFRYPLHIHCNHSNYEFSSNDILAPTYISMCEGWFSSIWPTIPNILPRNIYYSFGGRTFPLNNVCSDERSNLSQHQHHINKILLLFVSLLGHNGMVHTQHFPCSSSHSNVHLNLHFQSCVLVICARMSHPLRLKYKSI